jgi:AraC-like DNA-binding protein
MNALAEYGWSFRFCTENLSPAERLPTWHDIFGRSVSRRMLSPLSDDPFHVHMTVRSLASGGSKSHERTCVQHMTLSAGFTAQRTAELLTDGNDDIVLHIHEGGRRIVSQFGREASAEPFGALLTSNADRSTITLPEASRFYSIGLPRKTMKALVPGVEDALMRPMPADAGVVRLLVSYLGVLEYEWALSAPDLQRAVLTHIHDLAAMIVGATRETAEIARGRGLRAARLRAIKTDIAERLANGDVRPAALAARHHVTPRYIHKLVESDGTTLSQYILGQRLARVHRLLTDRRYSDHSIGELAFRVGFSDLSTFNHAFRRHYGLTPSGARAER